MKTKLDELRVKYGDSSELDQKYIEIYKNMKTEKENDFW